VLQLNLLVFRYVAAENARAVVALHVEQLHRRAEVTRHAKIHNRPGVRALVAVRKTRQGREHPAAPRSSGCSVLGARSETSSPSIEMRYLRKCND